MKIDRIILDPEGFVVIDFDSGEERSKFIDNCIPGGNPYGSMRLNSGSGPWHVAFKLSDLERITTLANNAGTNLHQPSVG